jgi:HSP20 family molecular chaperone IbpA
MSTELTTKQQTEATTVERTRGGTIFTPRFDIWETADELVLYGDMPGVDVSDLDVQFENNQLTIYGRVKPRHADVTYLGGEYGMGDFYRTFTIGESIDRGRISAELHNGVLILHLPKTEAVKPRRIEVKTK